MEEIREIARDNIDSIDTRDTDTEQILRMYLLNVTALGGAMACSMMPRCENKSFQLRIRDNYGKQASLSISAVSLLC